jgi:DNA repair protein RadD
MQTNPGNPVLVLPTGAGKSFCIAAFCSENPTSRILVLARQKELLEQNAEKLQLLAPDAAIGVYCASLGRKEIERVTFASVQSIAGHESKLGHIDVAIIDEAHQVSPNEETQARQLLHRLKATNPSLKAIGLTATPYRLGQGLLTQGETALFHGIIDPVSIEELVHLGALAPLRSKLTTEQLDTSGVKLRGGDFVESDLAEAVNSPEANKRIANEIVNLAGDRKSWILFCTGVEHAKAMAAELMFLGINAACVHGETPQAERDAMLEAYKDGRLRCLTNANVLTTGFDAPGTDLIGFLRPTLSPNLYVQMGGRGMRVAPDKGDCLCLDFAGVVQAHGPITAVKPPTHKTKQTPGDCPVKVCDKCHELVHLSVMVCPSCGFKWSAPKKEAMALHDVDIMQVEKLEMVPDEWSVSPHRKPDKPDMLRIDYGSDMWTERLTEYLCPNHEGYAGGKGKKELGKIFSSCGAPVPDDIGDVDAVCEVLNQAPPPAKVKYTMDGRWPRIKTRLWDQKWEKQDDEIDAYQTIEDDLFGDDSVPF